MSAGFGAVIWFSWIAPCRLRHRKVRAHERFLPEDREKVQESLPSIHRSSTLDLLGSPFGMDEMDQSPDLATPRDSPVIEFGLVHAITPAIAMFCRQDADLPMPCAAHTSERKIRFPTSTTDGRDAQWWFY